ncbi:hypothetical protein FDP41_013678 [Naegleria fowleri]|uniref:DUF4116 domain-containing protein n=1 Tax=Naegleria fowleri TaxID=5763 RepID=A0A6A5C1N8_NAEFO|nr:uncharacterized protein FDP41_013678 [Naegleria fowleri]KAF0980464.1 hypothetical protein FDP41_013678 [Naegleria fowleri]
MSYFTPQQQSHVSPSSLTVTSSVSTCMSPLNSPPSRSCVILHLIDFTPTTDSDEKDFISQTKSKLSSSPFSSFHSSSHFHHLTCLMKQKLRVPCSSRSLQSIKLAHLKDVQETPSQFISHFLSVYPFPDPSDVDIILQGVKCHGLALQFASKELRNCKFVVWKAIQQDARAIQFASWKLRCFERELWMECAKQLSLEALFHFLFVDLFKELHEKDMELTNNIIDLDTTEEHIHELKMLCEKVKEQILNDRELNLEILKHHAPSWIHVSECLQRDSSFAMQALAINSEIFHYWSPELQKTSLIVTEGEMDIAQDDISERMHLKSISQDETLSFDDCCSCCTSQQGVFHLSEHKISESIILNTTSLHLYSSQELLDFLKHQATEEMKNQREFMMQCVVHCGLSLQFASSSLRQDRDLVMQAVQQDGLSLQFASVSLRNTDREVVLNAVRSNGQALAFVSSECFRQDREIVLTALRHENWGGKNLKFASYSLQYDQEMIREAIKFGLNAYQPSAYPPIKQ